MNLFTKGLKTFAIFSLVAFFFGCNDDEGTEVPTLDAAFTHTINEATGQVNFINTSENADTYSWDFGDGTTSTQINPVKVYPTGTYTVVLTATNAAGASDTFEDVITINVPVQVALPFNFDNSNVIYDATVFNGASFEIVANPAPGGSNDIASSVGAITNVGANFEGVFFNLGEPIDLSMDMTILMDFWSDTPVDVLLKLEQGTAGPVEVLVSHGGTGWEELIFTFNSTDAYSQMTLFVDAFGTASGTFYFDNVSQSVTIDTTPPVITLTGDATINVNVGDTFTDPGATAMDNQDGDISANIVVGGDMVDTSTAGTYVITYNVMDATGNPADEVTRTVIVSDVPTEPTTSAPVPTHDASNVISIYSDSYTNIGIETFDPNWGQSGHTLVNPTFDPGDGNFALHYPNFNYQGTQFAAAEDMSAMEFIHIDMWTLDATNVQFTPISAGTGEQLVSLTPITPGEWVSYDIPLSDFSPMMFNDIIQLKFDGQAGTNPSNIWLDNIYFYTTASAATEPTTSAPVPTHDPANVISVYSDSYTNIGIETFDPNWGQSGHTLVNPTFDPGDGNFALHYPNFNYQGTQFAAAEDLSGMEFVHIDMWTADATNVQFTPISAGTGEQLVSLTPITAGEWVSYDIPLADFSPMMFNDIIQLKFDGQAGTNPSNIWLDNIYFYNTTPPTEPTSGAPIPTHPAADVISIYSDSYTNIGVDTFDPNWGQSGHTLVNTAYDPGDGNLALHYPNFNYQGTQLTGTVDMSEMEFVHIDMWTADATNVQFTPISAGTGELLVSLDPITAEQWVSYDIPLTDFSTMMFNDIIQLKFDGQAGTNPSNIWLDNIYFYKNSSGGSGCTGTPVAAVALPVDFEGCETFPSDLNFGSGITSELAANPSTSGNASGFALKVDKPAGSDFFAGVQNNFASTFPDITNRSFRMKIYSTKANTTFRFEVAQDDPGVGNPPPAFVTVNDANMWTEVTFSFTGIPAPTSYFRLVIKPDNDEMDSAITEGGTYYFDDIELIEN